MGVLINFPSQHCQSPLNDRLKEQDSESKANLQEDPSISNFEDKKQEQAFANILREWPCYSSFGNKLSLENKTSEVILLSSIYLLYTSFNFIDKLTFFKDIK